MTTHIVVCGAGFGGLELSARLSAAFGEQVQVTLIDKSDGFVFGFSKFELMFGRQERAAVTSSYASINKPGVTFRQELDHVDRSHRASCHHRWRHLRRRHPRRRPRRRLRRERHPGLH